MKTLEVKGEKLNANQALAVKTNGGPALVVAGAGTGKTRVIVERIIRLLNDGVEPDSIVALTFTEKAAQEMLDRLNERRGGYTLDVTVMTYNAFGEQLLRRFAPDIGLSANLKLIKDAAQIVFLRERLDELGLDYFAPVNQPDGQLKTLAQYFSRLKQSVVLPEDYSRYAESLPDKDEGEKMEKTKQFELAGAYKQYLELSRAANVIDYDDQLYLTLELFERRPNVLKQVQSEVGYLLVDEYQDTNPMQSDFLDALAGGQLGNIMVVGDDDQSIYGWRGATLENILRFKERYPQSKEIVLSQNYRSSQDILDAAYDLIRHNDPHRLEAQHGFDKRLRAQNSGAKPQIKRFKTLGDELTFVVKDIERRLKAGEEPGQIAVLARSNALVARLHDLFDAYGIEHSVAGISHDLYRQPLITDLLNVLKAVADLEDSSSLYHALAGTVFGVEVALLSPLSATARREHEPLIELLKSSDQTALQEAAATLSEWHELAATIPVSQLLHRIFKYRLEGWLHEQMAGDEEAAAVKASRDLSEFINTLREFERVAQRTTTTAYVENLEALTAAGEDITDDTLELAGHTVNVMTIHKAKGLEWRVVYVVDLTSGGFPLKNQPAGLELPPELSRTQSPANEHLLEERRLMYVAMTRAAEELILTHAERRSSQGTRRAPSIFIGEALGEEAATSTAVSASSDETVLSMPGADQAGVPELPPNMVEGEWLLLTPSQIESYIHCPLDFYYRHILHWPEEPSAAAETGRLLHELIAEINRAHISGRTLTQAQAKELLAERWPRVGFHSAKQRQRALESAQQTLAAFTRREAQAKHHPDLVEQDFNLTLPEARVRVRGRFDAVYDASRDLEIRDYKTGAVADQESADRKAKDSQQLSIYALAWQLNHGRQPDLLTLDFVSSGLVGRSSRSQRRIDNIRDKIGSIADKIRGGGNYPTGYKHDYCLHPDIS